VIGIFDSGHGGLTVQRALTEAFPAQGFIYLGDHANAPYGQRTAQDVLALTRAGIERLFAAGCRLVILACNTAAAVALRRLQQEWLPAAYPRHRVLGVMVPAVEAITGVPWHCPDAPRQVPARVVGIFATPLTVASDAYPREVARRAQGLRVVQQACPALADAIEAGEDEARLAALVEDYVASLLYSLRGAALDAVLLGCTHYPIVTRHFRRALPGHVRILSQPDLVAESLADYLRRHPDYAAESSAPCQSLTQSLPHSLTHSLTQYLTTGEPGRVNALVERFLGQRLGFTRVAA
jgi:glutamate racemase